MSAKKHQIHVLPLVATLLMLAGCMAPSPEPPASPTPAPTADDWRHGHWSTDHLGDLVVGFTYESEPGAACSVHFQFQGTADRFQPIAAWVIDQPILDDLDGPPGPLVRVATNDVTRAAGAEAWAAGDLVLPSDRPYEATWTRTATVRFTSDGAGSVWFAAESLAVAAAGADPTNRTTAAITFDCAGGWRTSPVVPAARAALIQERPAQGETSVRIDDRAQAGVHDAVTWQAHARSHVFGYVHGTPSKALVVEIEHPAGTETWLGLPTTALAAAGLEPIGGARFAFHGTDPGAHELRVSGVGAPAFLHAVVVMED